MVNGRRGFYHVMSRTSCGQYLLNDEAKSVFLKILRKQAGFCGVEVLAYCVMGNHFHLLVAVPEPCGVPDQELMRRYRLLYDPKRLPPSAPAPDVLEKLLAEDGEEGRTLREKLLARMHDLSVFMRELKQRFGIWFNRRHDNAGTIWAKRFTSVIVEPDRKALKTVAAYIDLNPVRAELVADPAEYRYSSFGRAMAGDKGARKGYGAVFCQYQPWKRLLPDYNLILYGKGYNSKGEAIKDRGRIDPERVRKVVERGGRVPLHELLRLRVRYFTAGAAIGSADFLNEIGEQWRDLHGIERKRNDHPMRGGQWEGLRSFRNLQVKPVGPG